ncbi:hypothetical protein N7493_001914 [Penicillium malachiteum]|uniref:Uncharacterized protein n=1 Tax=Penicillium malachiteum TaxID=1324776 RepID=A0AAD6HVN8_9EURO|nr:hypothetical protein N7493_001914 [Penicillium malachiteum]
MTPKPRSPEIICAESITLNVLLHENPKSPRQKRARGYISAGSRYELPFSTERDLVETLSFLSKTIDGSDYIPAVCVEQNSSGNSLEVIIAVNKSNPKDGNDILGKVKTGFEEIFEILHTADYEDRENSRDIEAKVRNSIIEMCSARILDRLRLVPNKHKKARDLTDLKERFDKARRGIKRIERQKLQNANLVGTSAQALSKLKDVMQLITKWSKYQVTNSLNEFLAGIWRLNKVKNLSKLLELIPTGKFGVFQDSDVATSLFNMISKLSRYYRNAKVLYLIAKKFPLVRNMQVRLADLPPEAFDRPDRSGYVPNIEDAASLLGIINGRRYQSHEILRYMNLAKDEKPSQRFSKQTRQILKESKIHSEIQLIAYCEIKSTPKLFPRVIASSKDACYLCNAFIKMHGRMHTSRTHGKLYTGWRLPALWQFKDLQRRFNQALLERARKTIAARMKDSHAYLHPPPPCESTLLLPLSILTATASSLELHIDVERVSDSASTTKEFQYTIERVESALPSGVPDEPLVIDPSRLLDETTYGLSRDGSCYISFQDTTLRITSCPCQG